MNGGESEFKKKMTMVSKNSNWSDHVRSIVLMISFIIIASIIAYGFQKMQFSETNIVLVYILFVLLAAKLTNGYFYGILSSILSTAAYNYFFTKPYFSFRVDDIGYIITFVIMIITAIITSASTSRIKQNVIKSNQKELEIRTLYQLTSHLAESIEIKDIAKITVKTLYKWSGLKTGFLCFDENGVLEKAFVQQLTIDKQIYREVDDKTWNSYQNKQLNQEYYYTEEFCDYPIHGRKDVLAILRIPRVDDLDPSKANLLHTVIDSIGIAMDRLIEERKRLKSKEEIVQERYRGNLLRSISHDVRTPLSGIMGMAEILMDKQRNNAEVYQLSCSIYKDADWLKSLVENILSLTKLQEGKLVINKKWEAIEELIGSAVGHFVYSYPDYKINIELPPEIVMVKVDAKLIVQVLTNLIDNAIKHSKPDGELLIKVDNDKLKNVVEISLIDDGEGIVVEDLPHIFKTFYTSDFRITDSIKGVGLGLSICSTIIAAHGGEIMAENRKDQHGAIFKFTLLKKEEADE